jgi:hypothetical protein
LLYSNSGNKLVASSLFFPCFLGFPARRLIVQSADLLQLFTTVARPRGAFYEGKRARLRRSKIGNSIAPRNFPLVSSGALVETHDFRPADVMAFEFFSPDDLKD